MRKLSENENRRLLSINGLAEYLGTTPGSIRTQMCKGEFPVRWIKLGRRVCFDAVDVDAWLDSLPRYGGQQEVS